MANRNRQDEFETLLKRIRERDHPDYGMISWDGDTRRVTVTVQFERNGCPDEDVVVRARALQYLEALTAEERAVAEVDVVFRDKKPVRAILKAKTGELSVKRLKELQEGAGLE